MAGWQRSRRCSLNQAEEGRDLLISPEKYFTYRPLSVAEPFGLGVERRFDLAEIVTDASAELLAERVTSVNAGKNTCARLAVRPSITTPW